MTSGPLIPLMVLYRILGTIEYDDDSRGSDMVAVNWQKGPQQALGSKERGFAREAKEGESKTEGDKNKGASYRRRALERKKSVEALRRSGGGGRCSERRVGESGRGSWRRELSLPHHGRNCRRRVETAPGEGDIT